MSISKTATSKKTMALVLYDKEMLNLKLSRKNAGQNASTNNQPRAVKEQKPEKYFRYIKSDTF